MSELYENPGAMSRKGTAISQKHRKTANTAVLSVKKACQWRDNSL